MTSLSEFMEKVEPEPNSGCWLWNGALNPGGYGNVKWSGRTRQAHRVSWILHGRPMLDELDLDHRCRVRSCVNPRHLEPVTNRVNILRGTGPTAINARRDLCIRGHGFSPPNSRGERVCRQCAKDRRAAFVRRHGLTPGGRRQ